jgi:PAS domain S-box-containing protein
MGAYSIKMKKQNTFVESLLANIGEGVYGVNNNGICTWMNQKALNMLGLKKNEIIGFNQHYIFHHHTVKDNEYSEKDCPIYQTIKDKQTRNCLEHFIKKDGSFFPVKLTVATAGNYGAVVIFSDFTEIKNYESKLEYEVYNKTQELQELNMTLENKIHEALEKNKKQQALLEHQSRLAALGEMIGNIAHQWRQPLSVITTSISGLQLQHEMGVPITKELISQTTNTIITNANYLSKTIDDFRDFIKNDNKEELFNLSEVVNHTTNLLNATLKSNEINLILNLDDTIICDGYPNQLSQVLLNIVNNAKDAFQEKDQFDKEIKIKTTKIENHFKIEISDNAGGISKKIKNKIFDPYFTTKHQSQGTGLGLYICANIIKKDFNGILYIEDLENTINGTSYKGTNFIIELPITD